MTLIFAIWIQIWLASSPYPFSVPSQARLSLRAASSRMICKTGGLPCISSWNVSCCLWCLMACIFVCLLLRLSKLHQATLSPTQSHHARSHKEVKRLLLVLLNSPYLGSLGQCKCVHSGVSAFLFKLCPPLLSLSPSLSFLSLLHWFHSKTILEKPRHVFFCTFDLAECHFICDEAPFSASLDRKCWFS